MLSKIHCYAITDFSIILYEQMVHILLFSTYIVHGGTHVTNESVLIRIHQPIYIYINNMIRKLVRCKQVDIILYSMSTLGLKRSDYRNLFIRKFQNITGLDLQVQNILHIINFIQITNMQLFNTLFDSVFIFYKPFLLTVAEIQSLSQWHFI